MAFSFLQSATDTANATTYTFSSQNLGTADADRYIAVGIVARGTSPVTVSSATIGGVSATISVQTTNTTPGYNIAAIIIAAVPSGTTGDIVVTFSAGVLRCGIAAYRLVGIDSITPADTGTSVANAPTTSLDIAANGVGIGMAMTQASTTTTWTGLTEDSDFTPESVITASSASLFPGTTQTGLTCTGTFSAPNASAGVFASWNPAAVAAGHPAMRRFGLCPGYGFPSAGNEYQRIS